jgi:hypothetical protein
VIQRFAQSLVVVAAIVGLACVDMSAPKGATSISVLQLPSPSVIHGDSMRDSLGVVKPITVIAYDGAGLPIIDAIAQIFVTDTTKFAHLTPTAILVGDSVGTARLTGQVGGLQTPGVGVPVTYRPAKILAGTPPTALVPKLGTDSATSLSSSTVNAVVRSLQDSLSQGIIVRFKLTYVPPNKAGATGVVAYLAGANNVPQSRDTTGANGVASISVVVNAFALDGNVVFGRPDSAVVQAESFFNGKLLQGSPVTIVVPIRGTVPR